MRRKNWVKKKGGGGERKGQKSWIEQKPTVLYEVG